MKHIVSLLSLLVLACSSPVAGEARAKLAEPSGLEQVRILSKGLE